VPIIKSAKKALRASKRKHAFNLRRKDAMKEVVKEVRKLIIAGEYKIAGEKLSSAYQAIDKAAKRGVIKPNTASRKKSRLARALHKSTSTKK